jgi:hypothetical protein
MTTYRSGRFAETLSVIPPDYGLAKDLSAEAALMGDGPLTVGNLKEHVLSLVFRAMAHHQLGQADEASELLQEARWRVPAELPAMPDLHTGAHRHRAAAWCMTRAAIREAEAVIELGGQNTRAATEQNNGGSR